MRIPRERLEIKPTHGGKDSASGWLDIQLKGLDIEGVDRLYVDLADVEGLRAHQRGAEDLFQRLRNSLDEGESD